MTSFISYPRTGFAGKTHLVPSAAFANIRDPSLRARLMAMFAEHYEALAKQKKARKDYVISTPARDLLDQWARALQSKVSRDELARIEADFEQLLNTPELGAVAGPLPPLDESLLDTSLVQSTLDDLRAINPSWATAVEKSFAPETLTRPSFSDDTILFRFIGGTVRGDASGGTVYDTNNPNGGHWAVADSMQQIPAKEGVWRGSFAIRQDWNGDGSYQAVRFGDLSPAMQRMIRENGIVGRAAPQPSVSKDHHLPGGGRQLFVPNVVKILDGVSAGVNTFFRSAWNPHV